MKSKIKCDDWKKYFSVKWRGIVPLNILTGMKKRNRKKKKILESELLGKRIHHQRFSEIELKL